MVPTALTNDSPRTKIVATVGPSTSTEAAIRVLLDAGASVLRINLSHGDPVQHRQLALAVRRAADAAGLPHAAVMFDTRGAEVRTLELLEPVQLAPSERVMLLAAGDGDSQAVGTPTQPGAHSGTGETELPRVATTYRLLADALRPGDRVLIDDGNVILRVLGSPRSGQVLCTAPNGAVIESRRKVTLPRRPTGLPVLTPEDRQDLELATELDVDFVAASFVGSAEDIVTVKNYLNECGGHAAIIAKIENGEAVDNIDAILEAADGIMVARGDLGVELEPEEVPVLQKELIRRCRRVGKPVITATQMLESMVHSPRPTRAEASDVANAVFDGTDALMLSGETAVGSYPEETVRLMSRIARRAERALLEGKAVQEPVELHYHDVTDAISHASCSVAQDLETAAIISATESGYTARMVARHRPPQLVIAATPDLQVSRRLALAWGVLPIVVEPKVTTDGMMAEALAASLDAHLVDAGDLVVLTAGVPVGTPGTTNMLQVQVAGPKSLAT